MRRDERQGGPAAPAAPDIGQGRGAGSGGGSPGGQAGRSAGGGGVPAGAPPRRRGRRGGLAALLLLLLVVGGFALYSWGALKFNYSDGERAGWVQKFSHKGWLCKTWEGELAMVNLPGTMPEIFHFTVRDDGVAARINQSMGQRVALHYEQHRGVPMSCFGETEYFVTEVRPVAGP
ncbi:MAG TPA: hypothetical protein VHR45_03835 [Thermoanaerobaculia bacterium]|nr:hypothetical protein [Thermoanaerobaculia bacterium]